MTNVYGDVFEAHLGSNVYDNKNREIGYTVGFCNNGIDFRAYVQNARRIAGEWKDFGVIQRSKSFSSQQAATAWGYKTAKERIAKLISK